MEKNQNNSPEENYSIEYLPDDYPNYDLSFKVIFVGDSGVGKSCLCTKAIKNTFDDNFESTIGFEFLAYILKVNNKIIKLQIWDTAGQEIYNSLINNFFSKSSMAVITYSIDNKESFIHAEKWLNDIRKKTNPKIKILLVGNKSDLENQRKVSKEEGLKFKDDQNLDLFMETSAKTGYNTKDILIEAAKLLYREYYKHEKKIESNIKIDNNISNDNNKIRNKNENICLIEFNYEGKSIEIQCNLKEKMKDIFTKFKNKTELNKDVVFFYSGTQVNEELILSDIMNSTDKTKNKMNVLVVSTDSVVGNNDQKQNEINCIIKSKELICPKCRENILIKFDNYNITLYNCKNKHKEENISFNKFEETQKIDLSKIICNSCKERNKSNEYNNEFYKCLTCNIDLCPLCLKQHNQNHNIINHENLNYICFKHKEPYYSFCKQCRQNLCMFCENEHNDHEIVYYGELISNSKQIKLKENELRETIDKFNENIKDIIKKLNKVMENMEKYYKIFINICSNVERKKRNYELLKNIKEINNNDNMIKELNEIINDNNIDNKFQKIFKIYEKMNKEDTEVEDDEITLIYRLNKDNSSLKLFGSDFVKNNKSNCFLKYENDFQLKETLDVKNISNKEDAVIIKLKGINKITNTNNMFEECSSLLSIPDIDKLNTSKIMESNNMFKGCSPSLKIPNIFNK